MKYTVIKPVQLPTGTLVKFGKEKAERFAALLAPAKGGRHECLRPVWVKAGEVIDIDDPAKHLLASLEPQGKAERADTKQAAPAVNSNTPQPAAAPAPESSGAGDQAGNADEDSANATGAGSDSASGE